jgi:hypothetical protein
VFGGILVNNIDNSAYIATQRLFNHGLYTTLTLNCSLGLIGHFLGFVIPIRIFNSINVFKEKA